MNGNNRMSGNGNGNNRTSENGNNRTSGNGNRMSGNRNGNEINYENEPRSYTYPKHPLEAKNIKYLRQDREGLNSYILFKEQWLNDVKINTNIPDGMYYDKENGILKRLRYPNIRENIRQQFPNYGMPLISALYENRYNGLVFFTPIELPVYGLDSGKLQLQEEIEKLYEIDDDISRIYNQPILQTLQEIPEEHPLLRVDPTKAKVSDIRTGDMVDMTLLEHYILRCYNATIEMNNLHISQYYNDRRQIPFYDKRTGIIAGFSSNREFARDQEWLDKYTYDDVVVYRFFIYKFRRDENPQQFYDRVMFQYDEPEVSNISSIYENYREVKTYEDIAKAKNIMSYLKKKEGVTRRRYKPPVHGTPYNNYKMNNYNPGPSNNNGAGPSQPPGTYGGSGNSSIRKITNLDLLK
jgi:hypothetical protein